jgi:hypothetical protein
MSRVWVGVWAASPPGIGVWATAPSVAGVGASPILSAQL